MAVTRPAILIVDDVPAFCREVEESLTAENLGPTVCMSPAEATQLATKHRFDLIITTLVMKEMSGFDLIRSVRGNGVQTPILMITGYGSPQAAVEATRLGASDYLNKPVAPAELIARVRQILDRAAAATAGGDTFRLKDMVTQDLAMKAIFEMVETIAPGRSRVLILGETGTGKQLIARAIHAQSDRNDKPFVEVNCAAIPETLLESELFGHERGSFTGATAKRIGRFEQARDGTIFLDEIGEMSAGLQSKLLHVLEDGKFQRVGGAATLQSRARVVAATNRDLRDEVDAGRFRADLYFRLNVIAIVVPPLRERPGDIPLLANHFLDRFREDGAARKHFQPTALEAMQRYHWPGNVRELQNLVERLAILFRGERIGAEALPQWLHKDPRAAASTAGMLTGPFRQARVEFERAYLTAAIDSAKGNLAQAARRAQLDRAQFYRMARRHGLVTKSKQT